MLMTSDGSVWERTKQGKRKEAPRGAQTRNNKNKEMGEVNKCFKCDSEFHYANKCTIKKSKGDGRKSKE